MLQVLPGPDKTYKRNYDIFRKWIDEHVEVQGQLDETRPRKYITRENVDLYFSTVVAHRGDIQPDTARRMVPSLQFYADREIHNVLGERFVVESIIVTQSLKAQKGRYISIDHDNEVDPHRNLPTNIITMEEYKAAVHHIIQNGTYIMSKRGRLLITVSRFYANRNCEFLLLFSLSCQSVICQLKIRNHQVPVDSTLIATIVFIS
jgi:hypothetical protein